MLPALEHGTKMLQSLQQILKTSEVEQFLGDFEKFFRISAQHLEPMKDGLDSCMNHSLPVSKANVNSLDLIERPHMRALQGT